MIGALPRMLNVGGVDYPIRSDFRVILGIFEALMDDELTDNDKALVCLKSLFFTFSDIPKEHLMEAAEKANWFMDGGDMPKVKSDGIKSFDWKQDESILFPAINKVAGYETRSCKYLHWWTFLGFFNEIGEGLFSTVMHIRNKVQKGKKLDDQEKDILKTHRNFIYLYTDEERAEIEETEAAINRIFGLD